MKFRIADIKVINRKRVLRDITALAESISSLGLLNPITIREDGTLIAGYHRLEACKQLGWHEIEVTIAELDQLHTELAEIDENLIRNELHWTERDRQLVRRKAIYEVLYPETKQGGDRKSEEAQSKRNNFALVPTFTDDTATQTGQSKRNVELSIQRANSFSDEELATLRDKGVTQTEATQLARLEPQQRSTALHTLASGHPIPLSPIANGTPPALHTSESNEWYTVD